MPPWCTWLSRKQDYSRNAALESTCESYSQSELTSLWNQQINETVPWCNHCWDRRLLKTSLFVIIELIARAVRLTLRTTSPSWSMQTNDLVAVDRNMMTPYCQVDSDWRWCLPGNGHASKNCGAKSQRNSTSKSPVRTHNSIGLEIHA